MSAFRIHLLGKRIDAEPKVVDAAEIHEELRQIGLEWKTADFFHERTVVLIIEPYEDEPTARIAELEGRLARIAEEAA